jgi:hypothetical protein
MNDILMKAMISDFERDIFCEEKVFVDPVWLNGTVAPSHPDFFLQPMIAEKRARLIPTLRALGFVITFDENVSSKNITFLNACFDGAKTNTEFVEYEKRWKAKISEILRGGKIKEPLSVTFKDYLKDPFFASVLKNEYAQRGMDKFLIETPEQLEKVKAFHKSFEVQFIHDYVESSIFQQRIETPSEYNTSLRVLATSAGDVLASSLKYNKPTQVLKSEMGVMDKYLANPKSPFFLKSKSIVSNSAAGGDRIIIDGNPTSVKHDKKLLKMHGIDPGKPTVPVDVAEAATKIAETCERRLGIISGIDFIQNAEDGSWYFLEANHNPALNTYAQSRGISIKQDGAHENPLAQIDEYMEIQDLDLQIRIEALLAKDELLGK